MADSALHPALFRQSAIAEDTIRLNDALVDLMTGLPEWWNVGAEADPRGSEAGPWSIPAPNQITPRSHHRHPRPRRQ